MSQRGEKLTRESFNSYYGNNQFFTKVFGVHREYEFILKPCHAGFDVFLYAGTRGGTLRKLGESDCTRSGSYFEDDTERDALTWEKALEIANLLLERHIPKGIERL